MRAVEWETLCICLSKNNIEILKNVCVFVIQSKYMTIKAIAVFCGSKSGQNPLYEIHTQKLGQILADAGVNIVYGGGNKGLMGAVANSAMLHKGNVIGIMPELLSNWEHANHDITELHIVDTMHTRKRLLYEKCDAAIILPGGYGTLDEVFEILTWNQLDIHQKKIFFLNTDGFYDHLIAHIHKMYNDGFLYNEPAFALTVLHHPEEIIPYLVNGK